MKEQKDKNPKNELRIFISYSHKDKAVAQKIYDELKGREYYVFWDENIKPGSAFSSIIKNNITHSHLFIPLFTKNSKDSHYTHQETGYAMARNIPILPISVGKDALPSDMTAHLQAVTIKEDLKDLSENISNEIIYKTIHEKHLPIDLFRVAFWPEKRAEYLAEYSHHFEKLGPHGKLRQKGAFSSFSIPDESIDNRIWKKRDKRSKYYHHIQREERKALEKYALIGGCKLIIDPSLKFKQRPLATLTRLETLLEFLKKNKSNKEIEVAISTSARKSNVTIVGSWYSAISINPDSGGYRQTIFNCYAPEVLNDINEFDMEFEEILNSKKMHGKDPLDYAINEIEKEISELEIEIKNEKN